MCPAYTRSRILTKYTQLRISSYGYYHARPAMGGALRPLHRQKGLSSKASGRLLHARQATVSKLESGKSGTQLRVLIDALAALELELVVRPRSKADEADRGNVLIARRPRALRSTHISTAGLSAGCAGKAAAPSISSTTKDGSPGRAPFRFLSRCRCGRTVISVRLSSPSSQRPPGRC